MKQRDRTRLKNKIKKAFSLEIRLRDGRCLKCGKLDNLQCSHVLSVGAHPNMQFDLDNAISLCTSCHLYWWHREPLAASRWFEARWPGKYDQLLKKSNSLLKNDLLDLAETFRIKTK